jgi:hypothetical protein
MQREQVSSQLNDSVYLGLQLLTSMHFREVLRLQRKILS